MREALASDLARSYGAEVAPEQVALTSGCNQAFCAAIDLIAGPVERWGARGVGLSVYVRDPDGNTVEFVETT